MKLDDKVGCVISRLHDQQRVLPQSDHFTTQIIDEHGHIHDIILSRLELENNGPALHPLVKQMLVNRGITDD